MILNVFRILLYNFTILRVFFVSDFNKILAVDRIKELAKSKGYSLTFLYKTLNLPNCYLRDVKANKTTFTEERISLIANFLNTTPEYIKGETNIKEKAAFFPENELSEIQQAMVNWVMAASPEQLQALYDFLLKTK